MDDYAAMRAAEGEVGVRELLLVTHDCKHVEGEFVWPVGVERERGEGKREGGDWA